MENIMDYVTMEELNEQVLQRVLANAKLYNVQLVETKEELLKILKKIYYNFLGIKDTHPIKDFEGYLLYVRNWEPFNTVLPFTCHFSHLGLTQKYTQQTIPGDGNCLFNSLRLGILQLKDKTAQEVRYEICDELTNIIPLLLKCIVADANMSLMQLLDTYDSINHNGYIDIKKYIKRIRGDSNIKGDYGTRVEIMAAQLKYNVNICIYHMDGSLDLAYEIAKKTVQNCITIKQDLTRCDVALYLCGSDPNEQGAYKTREHFELLIPKIPIRDAVPQYIASTPSRVDSATPPAALTPPSADTAVAEPDAPAAVAEPPAVIAKSSALPAVLGRSKAAASVAEPHAVVAKPLVAAVGSPTKTGAEPHVSAAAGTPTKAESESQTSLIAPQVKMPKFTPPTYDQRYLRNVRSPEDILQAQSALPSKSTHAIQLKPQIQSKSPIALTPTSVHSSNSPKFNPPNDPTHVRNVRSPLEDILPAQSAPPSESTQVRQLEPPRVPLTPTSVQLSNGPKFKPPNDIRYARTIKSTREKYIKSARSVNTHDITYKYKYLKYKKKYLTLKNNNNF